MTTSPYSDSLRVSLDELDRERRRLEAATRLRYEDIDRLSRGVLTTKEVAGILGCDDRTVRRLCHFPMAGFVCPCGAIDQQPGGLPHFRVRKHLRIKASDLQAYMSGSSEGVTKGIDE